MFCYQSDKSAINRSLISRFLWYPAFFFGIGAFFVPSVPMSFLWAGEGELKSATLSGADFSTLDDLIREEAENQDRALENARRLYDEAEALFRRNRPSEAISLLDEALQSLPKSIATEEAVLKLNALRREIRRAERGSTALLTAAAERGIPILLAEGRSQYENQNFEGARETFSEVERLDPANREAREYLSQILQRQLDEGRYDRYRSKGEMLLEVSESWVRPRVFDRDVDSVGDEKEDGLRERLGRIVLPRVNFEGVTLSRVIDTLSALSVDFDPTREGVNIVLLDPAGADPAVNITLRNLGLDRILDFVAESVGYEYDVQADAVVVRQGSGGGTRVETEFFSISRSTIIRLTGIGANRTPRAAPFDPFAPAPLERTPYGRSVAEEEESLKSFLQRAGVPFDAMMNANLALADGQLIVTNTPRNLEKVRNLLRRYSEVKQVEIEAKFLEVQQGDLDEIGLNWEIRSGNDRFQSHNRTLNDAFSVDKTETEILVNGVPVASNPAPSLPRSIDLAPEAGNLAKISGVIGKVEVSALIRALSRKEGSDLLSAPKVTVLSGKTAEIVVAQELRYPESFGDIESEVGSGTRDASAAGVTITAGTPQDFNVRNIGVEMEVTLTVEDDNSISLLLEPRVTEFEGFVEYGGPSVALSGDLNVTVPAGFFQPIFSVRRVRTEVTIWDGATVVMGGVDTRADPDRE